MEKDDKPEPKFLKKAMFSGKGLTLGDLPSPTNNKFLDSLQERRSIVKERPDRLDTPESKNNETNRLSLDYEDIDELNGTYEKFNEMLMAESKFERVQREREGRPPPGNNIQALRLLGI